MSNYTEVILNVISYFSGKHIILLFFLVTLQLINFCCLFKLSNKQQFLKQFIKEKFAGWILVILAFLLSVSLVEMETILDINFLFSKILGWMVVFAYILHEIKSAINTLVRMNIKIPNILLKAIHIAEQNIDSEDKNSDGKAK